MTRSRPPSMAGGAPPLARAAGRPPCGDPGGSGRLRRGALRGRRRPAALLALTAALGACAVTACGLLLPGLVLGAEPSAPKPGPEIVLEKPATLDPGDPGALAAPTTVPGSDAALVVASASSTALADGSLLVTLPWGSGQGEVGLAQPVEGLTRGPEALAVAPDGRIAVLDSVNRRVVLLDPQGQWTGSAAVPLAEPRFLAVDDERLYVLDCDNSRQLTTLDWTGAALGTVPLPSLADVVTGLFATAQGPCVEVAHARTYFVTASLRATAELETEVDASPADLGSSMSLRSLAGRPAAHDASCAAQVTFQPDEGVHVRFSELDPASLLPTSTVEYSPALASGMTLEHLVSVDTLGSSTLVIGARLLDAASTAAGPASLVVTRFVLEAGGTGANMANAGETGTLLLADCPFAYLGQPYTVAPDGRVFQPVASDAGYSIVQYAFATGEVQP